MSAGSYQVAESHFQQVSAQAYIQCEDWGSMALWSVGILPHHYMVPHLRRLAWIFITMKSSWKYFLFNQFFKTGLQNIDQELLWTNLS